MITTLLIAAISAITVLAYKHPSAYTKMYWPIYVIIIISYMVVATWDGALSIAVEKINALGTSVTHKEVAVAISELKISNAWYLYLVWFFIASLYLSFLLWLPHILKDDNIEKNKPKNE